MASVGPMPGYKVETPQLSDAEVEKLRSNYDIYGDMSDKKMMKELEVRQADTPDSLFTTGTEINLVDDDDISGGDDEDDDDDDGGEGRMFIAAEPYLQWIRCFGLLPASIKADPDKRSGWCSSLARLYSVIVLLIYLFGFGRALAFLSKIEVFQFDLILISTICLILFALQAVGNCINMHRKQDDYYFWLDQWIEIENWFRVDIVSEAARNLSIGCLCVCLTKLIGLTVLIGLILHGDLSLPPFLSYLFVYPANPSDMSDLGILYQSLVYISHIIMIQGVFCPLYLFIIASSSLSKQFELITDRFHDEISNQSLTAEVIRTIREKHQYLTRLLLLLDDIFAPIIFAHLISALLFACILIYPVIYITDHEIWRCIYMGILALHLITLFLAISNADTVQHTARAIDVHEGSVGKLEDDERRELMVFSDKLRNQRFHITACSCFRLTRQSIGLILLFLLIYVVLLLQNKQVKLGPVSYNITMP